jgi:hypothetical protein
MNYDHDHPELCPLPDCKSLGADPEAPAGRFRALSRPTSAGPRPRPRTPVWGRDELKAGERAALLRVIRVTLRESRSESAA